jgi:hypothetical protein
MAGRQNSPKNHLCRTQAGEFCHLNQSYPLCPFKSGDGG